jgi:hypothetical protein
MMVTPIRATILAASVAQDPTPSHSQTRLAVRKGATAKVTATSATDEWRKALMQRIVAVVEHIAAMRPGRPITRIGTAVARLDRGPRRCAPTQRLSCPDYRLLRLYALAEFGAG